MTADVSPQVHSFEVNPVGRGVGGTESPTERWANGSHSQHPPAARDDLFSNALRSSMENLHTSNLVGSG